MTASSHIRNQNTVVFVSDSIAHIYGLCDLMQGEMLEFPPTVDGTCTYGLAPHLERGSVG